MTTPTNRHAMERDGGDEMPSCMKAAMEKKAKEQAEAEQKARTAAPGLFDGQRHQLRRM